MRALRVLLHTCMCFLVAAGIMGTVAACVFLGLRWFGPLGPVYLAGPVVFIAFFLLILSDRSFK